MSGFEEVEGLVTQEQHAEVLDALALLTRRTDDQDIVMSRHGSMLSKQGDILSKMEKELGTISTVLRPFILSRCHLCKIFEAIDKRGLWKYIFILLILCAGDSTFAQLLREFWGLR